MNTKKMLIAIAAVSFSLNAIASVEVTQQRKLKPCKQLFVVKTEDGFVMATENTVDNYSPDAVMFAIAKSPDAKLSSEAYKATADLFAEIAAKKELKRSAIANQPEAEVTTSN